MKLLACGQQPAKQVRICHPSGESGCSGVTTHSPVLCTVHRPGWHPPPTTISTSFSPNILQELRSLPAAPDQHQWYPSSKK